MHNTGRTSFALSLPHIVRMNLDNLVDTVTDTLQQHYPTHHWAQLALGMLTLVLAALFAQWVVARIVLYFAHRLLVLTEREAWDKALARHRAYHQLWYAVPFAAVAIGIGDVPHIGHVAQVIERLAHAGAWVCVFFAMGGALSAWQDV
jgi:miniconductance mechanosensitive channel